MDGLSERPSILGIAQGFLGNSRANFSLVTFLFFVKRNELDAVEIAVKSFDFKSHKRFDALSLLHTVYPSVSKVTSDEATTPCITAEAIAQIGDA